MGYGLNMVYLDYRKAFDRVPHQRLEKKLKTNGIKGKLLHWPDKFLIKNNEGWLRGTFSQLLEVLSGVPQGAVLGPFLFLLYVNKLSSWIKCDMMMFADDTELWCIITKNTDSLVLQNHLDSLQSLSDIWQLKCNADKCKVMHTGY